MKYLSALITDARASLGGTTFARNRAGVYTRARVAPTQPRTVSQVANRTSFGSISQQWRTLTQPQRDAWNTASTSVVLHDSLGQSYNPSGAQYFQSCGRNLAFIGVAPTVLPPPPGTTPLVTRILSLHFAVGSNGVASQIWAVTAAGTIPAGHPIFQITPGLSAGLSFINPARYRNLSTSLVGKSSGLFNLIAAYGALLPTPTIGELVGLRARFIDPTYGISTPWQYERTVVVLH